MSRQTFRTLSTADGTKIYFTRQRLNHIERKSPIDQAGVTDTVSWEEKHKESTKQLMLIDNKNKQKKGRHNFQRKSLAAAIGPWPITRSESQVKNRVLLSRIALA